jgi:hypothetical protein
MSKYLRHKEDGRVFIYTDLLATDPNLEPYDPEPIPAPKAAAETPAEKPKRKKELVADEPALEI